MAVPKHEKALNKDFGNWLKSKRVAKGLTQAGAVEESKLSLNTWSNLEVGHKTKRETVLRAVRAVSTDKADETVALEKAGFIPDEDDARAGGVNATALAVTNKGALVNVTEVVKQARKAQEQENHQKAEELWHQAIAAASAPEQYAYSRELMLMLYEQWKKCPHVDVPTNPEDVTQKIESPAQKRLAHSIIQVYDDLRSSAGGAPDLLIRKMFRSVRHWPEDAGGVFVGRRADVDNVVEEFDKWQFMTLWGREGSGKTELVRAVTQVLKQERRDGVCFVPLGTFVKSWMFLKDLTDQERVAHALLFTLKADWPEGQTATAAVAAALETSDRLIVLDGCTSLRDGCGALVRTLLQRCPNVRILATCRTKEGLGLDKVVEEGLFEVPPLDLDFASPVPPTAAVLFRSRAKWAGEEAQLLGNEKLEEHICRKAEGLTTYIAWAASLLRSRQISEIAEEIQPPIPAEWWSWLTGLLTAPEKELLNRLTIFPSGWTREAARQVCAGEDLSRGQIPVLLEGLDAGGLIRREGYASSGCSSVWEPLYEYIRRDEMQDTEQNTAELREALLDWCLAVAEKDGNIYNQINDVEKHYDQFEDEMDNIRASLAWALAGPPEAMAKGLRLAWLIWGFWNVRGYWTEGRYWLKRLLEVQSCPPSEERLNALNGAGVLAIRQRDYEDAKTRLEEALACRYDGRTLDLEASVCNSLGYLYSSWARVDPDKMDEAGDYYQKACDLYRQSHPDHPIREMKWPLNGLGDVEMSRYERDRLPERLKTAESHYTESRRISQMYDDEDGNAQALRHLASVSLKMGEEDQAEAYLKQSLALLNKLKNRADTINVLEQLADLAAEKNQKQEWQKALRLYAAAQNLRRSEGVFNEAPKDYKKRVSDLGEKLGAKLGEVEYERLWKEELKRSPEAVVSAATL